MKIKRNTPDVLVLDDTPWIIGIMLIIMILLFVGGGVLAMSDNFLAGAIFALSGGGFGFLFFAIFVRRTQLMLLGPENRLILRRQSLFGYSSVEHELSALDCAEVESTTSRSNNRTRTTSRIALVLDKGMSAGRHPVTRIYSSGSGARSGVVAINDWLERHRHEGHA